MHKLLLATVALVLVVLSGSAGSPSVQAVVCGPYCDTSWGGTTPTATAIGSSCSIAQTNLTAQLQSYANSYCGTRGCQLAVTITVPCYATSGGYAISGYATFGCRDSTC